MRLKRTGILTKIIIVALLIYVVTSLVVLRGRIEAAEALRDERKAAVAELTADNDDKQYALDHSTDDAVIEDIARGEGYVYQDEEVYYAN